MIRDMIMSKSLKTDQMAEVAGCNQSNPLEPSLLWWYLMAEDALDPSLLLCLMLFANIYSKSPTRI